jgi:hypothetical protein
VVLNAIALPASRLSLVALEEKEMKGGESILFGWPGTAGELCHEGKGTLASELRKQEGLWQPVFSQKC